jgi:methyl-accepting chemotaxis protein
VLNAVTMRTVLDTVGTRLDEARDISRYLIGLLVFLGLLGTFWGLLQTVSSIGATIQSLDVGSNDAGVLFEDLKTGLQAPLTGMGTAFSSSLFGLTGSLIVGFLDLQAGQAQNRFYTELEDWLSTLTDLVEENGAGAGTGAGGTANIEAAIDRLAKLMEESAGAAQSRAATKAMASLAEGIQGLVKHLRSEQKLMREWADAQTEQNERMEQLLTKLNEALDAEHTT